MITKTTDFYIDVLVGLSIFLIGNHLSEIDGFIYENIKLKEIFI